MWGTLPFGSSLLAILLVLLFRTEAAVYAGEAIQNARQPGRVWARKVGL